MPESCPSSRRSSSSRSRTPCDSLKSSGAWPRKRLPSRRIEFSRRRSWSSMESRSWSFSPASRFSKSYSASFSTASLDFAGRRSRNFFFSSVSGRSTPSSSSVSRSASTIASRSCLTWSWADWSRYCSYIRRISRATWESMSSRPGTRFSPCFSPRCIRRRIACCRSPVSFMLSFSWSKTLSPSSASAAELSNRLYRILRIMRRAAWGGRLEGELFHSRLSPRASRQLFPVRDPAALHLLVELLVQVQPLEDKLGRRGHERRRLERPEDADRLLEAGDLLDPFEIVLRRHGVGDFHAPAGIEVIDHFLQGVHREVLVEDLQDRAVDELLDEVVLLLVLADVLHLDLAAGRGQDRMHVAHARHDLDLLQAQRPLFRVPDQAFVIVDRHAHAHARGLVDLVRFARLERQVAENLLDELRHLDLVAPLAHGGGLLLHDRHLVLDVLRIVRADLDVEAVFQRRDDPAAAGIVLGGGARHDHHVERQGSLVAFHFDVLLFHHIEETHLDFFGEIGELVDGEDAAVGARDQAVMDRLLVGEVAPLGDLDGVDLADQIGDRDVRRRELFAVPVVAPDPFDREGVAFFFQPAAAGAADRLQPAVVDLAPLDDRDALVQKRDQAADDSRLCLPALAQKDHVVARQDRVLDVRDDGFVVADDGRQDGPPGLHVVDQVLAHLLPHREDPLAAFFKIA